MSEPHPAPSRLVVRGKFLFEGEHKFWAKGVTYGTFAPDARGDPFPDEDEVARDFGAMAAAGFNTVRVYTAPPRWLLDCALANGLRVMIGLAWEQHVAFLDDRALTRRIRDSVRNDVRRCAGHPAVLCFSVGNEIPASIVRWHGRARIERFLRQLYRVCKDEDPNALVTYVNFPTTEYLQLGFLDFACFNVYLESEQALEAYLARLQNLVGGQPLLMAEIGLDSASHGRDAQAEVLRWQIRSCFAAGCVGAMVFAWTDEWHRGGHEIMDWDFGLTDRFRLPKPALGSVSTAFAAAPFPADIAWPRFSVVVCSYNGSATIRDTLAGLAALDYPNYEVIVVNDGSTDATPAIAAGYDVRLITTENRGLSNARNTGWQEADGELVAYIDDDAYPDPHWLQYLAHVFMTTEHAAVGGPNVAPPGDGPIADCIANAPGRPVHVLIGDRLAEHIPGCNMAFRREVLAAIDGFDPVYRAAGDDVDVCWRVQEAGGTIGFHATALDWHHCRNSVKTYWKQQQGYGKAEALLEAKWPQRYNAAGHFSWTGSLYGKGITQALTLMPARIYQGVWGSAAFQSIYQPTAATWSSLPLMPEWFLLIALLAFLATLGAWWPPLLIAGPLALLALLFPLGQALLSGARAQFPSAWPSARQRLWLHTVTAAMHLMQPIARLVGRLRHGLTPWRRRLPVTPHAARRPNATVWIESWQAPEAWLDRLRGRLERSKVGVRVGGDWDGWDLEIRAGVLAAARLTMTCEEHGAGRQLLKFRLRPVPSIGLAALASALVLLGALAASDGTPIVGTILGGGGLALLLRGAIEYELAAQTLRSHLQSLGEAENGR